VSLLNPKNIVSRCLPFSRLWIEKEIPLFFLVLMTILLNYSSPHSAVNLKIQLRMRGISNLILLKLNIGNRRFLILLFPF